MLFHPNVFLSTNMSGSFFTVDVDTVGWTLQVLFDDNGPAANASINPAGESKPAEGGTAVSGETAAPTNSTDTQPAPAAESGTEAKPVGSTSQPAPAETKSFWEREPSSWTIDDVKAELLKHTPEESVKNIITGASSREELAVAMSNNSVNNEGDFYF